MNATQQIRAHEGTAEEAPLQPGAFLTAVRAPQRPRALKAPTAPQGLHTAQSRSWRRAGRLRSGAAPPIPDHRDEQPRRVLASAHAAPVASHRLSRRHLAPPSNTEQPPLLAPRPIRRKGSGLPPNRRLGKAGRELSAFYASCGGAAVPSGSCSFSGSASASGWLRVVALASSSRCSHFNLSF